MPTAAQAKMLQLLTEGWEIHKLHGYYLVHPSNGELHGFRNQRTPPVLIRHGWIEFSHREYTTDVYVLTNEGHLALERYQNTR